jgi:branched-chain amino acid transport system substrate-binding protein
VLTDLSGQYADFYGDGSVLAARLAVEDFGSAVLGLPVEIVVADHQNRPDLGAAIARQWFGDQGVLAVADVPSSAVGLAVHGIARDANRVFLASGPFTTEITGRGCSPNTVQWTTDNWAIGNSIGRSIVSEGGTRWFFVTADFAFGHDLEANARRAVLAQGGAMLGSVRHPFGTSDLSSYLLQAQASGADVIALANAGSDFNNAVKQAQEFGVTASGVRVAGLATVINNVHALGLEGAQGLYATAPFYWDLDEATRAWQDASRNATPSGRCRTRCRPGPTRSSCTTSRPSRRWAGSRPTGARQSLR